MWRSDLNLSSGSTTMMTYKGLKTEEGLGTWEPTTKLCSVEMLWNGKAADKNCYTWMNFNLSGASINIAIAKVKFIDGASLQIVIRHLCCD